MVKSSCIEKADARCADLHKCTVEQEPTVLLGNFDSLVNSIEDDVYPNYFLDEVLRCIDQ